MKLRSIDLFVNSLAETNYSGTLIIFSDKYFKIKNNNIINIRIIKINKEWPFINNSSYLKNSMSTCILPKNIKNYKWAIYRYGIYCSFMSVYYNFYSYVFLLDIRDSIFQVNPELIKFEQGVYLCEDASFPFSIKDDKWNKKWLLPFYNINDSIFNNIPLNGGSIYGESHLLLKFMIIFSQYLKRYYYKTSDQGIINLLYYNHSINSIKIIINRNDKGFIYNMGIELKFKNIFPNNCFSIHNNLIYRKDNSLPYIIHQYDRNSNLKNFVSYIYSSK